MKKSLPRYTVPSMTPEQGAEVAGVLQGRLDALNDLALTLKHIHWNVVGPHFIAVHEMLDPQVDTAREYADELAERIATLGSSPVGTPGALVKARTWDDYSIGRADAIAHLGALDLVYQGVITDYREAAEAVEESRPGQQRPARLSPGQTRAVPLVRPGAPGVVVRSAVDQWGCQGIHGGRQGRGRGELTVRLDRSSAAGAAKCGPQLGCGRAADTQRPAHHHVIHRLVQFQLPGGIACPDPEFGLTGALGRADEHRAG